jgi:hypothetical protein
VSVVVSTFAELERELAKRGARMMARIEPGKAHHQNLVTLHASAIDARGHTQAIEVFFVGATLEGATAGALARLDFAIAKVTNAGISPS